MSPDTMPAWKRALFAHGMAAPSAPADPPPTLRDPGDPSPRICPACGHVFGDPIRTSEADAAPEPSALPGAAPTPKRPPPKRTRPESADRIAMRAVALAAKMVDAHCATPIFGCALLGAAPDGTLTLDATDGGHWFHAQAPGVPGICVAVNAKSLLASLKEGASLVGAEVETTGEVPNVTAKLRLTGGATLSAFPAAKFCERSDVPTEGLARFGARAFREALDRVWPSIADDSNRYGLNGIWIEAGGPEGRSDIPAGFARFVGTDGTRLHYVELPFLGPFADGWRVSRSDVACLRALLATLDDGAEVGFGRVSVPGETRPNAKTGAMEPVMRHRYAFTTKQEVLTGCPLEENFPDYRQVLPDRWERTWTVDAEPLRAALKKCLAWSSRRGDAPETRWDIQPDQLTVSRVTEKGKVSVEVPARLDGEPIELGFNVRYMLDALDALDAAQINFRLAGGPLTPCTATVPGVFVCVMPVRLD